MAKRKLYDIVPPQKRSIYFKKKETIVQTKKRDFKIKKNFIYLLLMLFVGLVIYWNFSVAKSVKIELWPQTYAVDFTTSAAFSTDLKNFSLADLEFSNPVLPSELIEINGELSKEFPASTAKSSNKATGVIRVYNESNRTITLVEGTRFLSSTEPARLFRTQKRITVPSHGHIDAPVVASEPGPEYNIEPASFSIPGLRNYSPPQLYYDVYGKSLSSMQGGSLGQVKIISDKDVAAAEKEALDLIDKKAIELLQERAGKDYRILDKSAETEVLEKGLVDASIGQQKDTFVYQIKFRAVTLAVKTDYLKEFAREYLLASIPANRVFKEDALEIEFLPSTFALESQEQGTTRVSADISIKGRIYPEVDEESIKEIAIGRQKKDIFRYVIEIYPELKKQPLVSFKPFWAKKASFQKENIEIGLNFGESVD